VAPACRSLNLGSVACLPIVISRGVRRRALGADPKAESQTPNAESRNSGATLNLLACMATEEARQRKFAELMAHHVLSDEDWNMLPAVMDHERMADEQRENGGATRPGLDRLLLPARIQRLDFLHQLRV